MLFANYQSFLNRLKKLDSINRFLSMIDEYVNISAIAKRIEDTIDPGRSSSRTKRGRQAYPTDVMVRMIILQQLHNLSDEQCEYQCLDRLSFSRFIGVRFGDPVPDAKTLWRFREQLNKHDMGPVIFEEIEKQAQQHGYIPRGGQIIDGSFVKAPIQRNSKEENEKIKAGEVPDTWSDNKKKQKDVDARWAKKGSKSYYGYKMSGQIDNKHKLLRRVHVSAANEHDSQHLEHVLDKSNTSNAVYADSAYAGKEQLELIRKEGLTPKINSKGQRNKPLTERQKKRNKTLSKVRSRVEHVFADMNSMGGKFIRCIGLSRAKLALNMKAACYNIRRLCFLKNSTIVTF